jgi:RNA polymerase sigma-B factor
VNTVTRPYARIPGVTHEVRQLRTTDLFARLSAGATPEAQAGLRDQLVLLNVGVACGIARRYRHRGLEDDDLDQTAVAALIRAVQGFDPGLGNDFLTYAVPSIRGEILRSFRDQGWMIRVPRRIQETQSDIGRVDPDINGRERCSDAHLDELATRLGRPRRDVSEALTARGCFSPSSLDLVLDPDNPSTLGDNVPSEDDWLSRLETRDLLHPLLRRLPEREQRLLFLRYVKEWTQISIAEDLGITQMRVSRILARIHRSLREELAAAQTVA